MIIRPDEACEPGYIVQQPWVVGQHRQASGRTISRQEVSLRIKPKSHVLAWERKPQAFDFQDGNSRVQQ